MTNQANTSDGIAIAFRNVTYRVVDGSNRELVSGINLTVKQGETLVLLGRSGSGKTTLLRMMNGMLLPSEGVVEVQGRSTPEWDRIALRRGIGYVIQEGGLFPHFTVSENVALVPTLEKWDSARTASRVEEVLKIVALAADPPILLMDEPFAALDPVTRAELQREFRELARRLGKTIVFVTHDLREALFLASDIVLMQSGLIVANSPPKEFLGLEHPEVRAFAESLVTASGKTA
jgi:osmoprotectant transport system ATP-binding protein